LSDSKLIVGLGNPGKTYEATRHNIGFRVVQNIVQRFGLRLSRKLLLKSFMAEGLHEGQKFYVLMPLTFMNHSGWAVKRFMGAKQIDPKDVLVVADDLDLDFGQLRIRASGSHGGHKGLSSVIAHLGTENFSRLKAGIGRPERKDDVTDFVLSSFTQQEKKELDGFIERAADCCCLWLTEGITEAMSQFNKRKE